MYKRNGNATYESLVPTVARLDNLPPYFLVPDLRFSGLIVYTFLLWLDVKTGRYPLWRSRGQLVSAAVRRRGSGRPGWMRGKRVHLDAVRSPEARIIWGDPVLIVRMHGRHAVMRGVWKRHRGHFVGIGKTEGRSAREPVAVGW